MRFSNVKNYERKKYSVKSDQLIASIPREKLPAKAAVSSSNSEPLIVSLPILPKLTNTNFALTVSVPITYFKSEPSSNSEELLRKLQSFHQVSYSDTWYVIMQT